MLALSIRIRRALHGIYTPKELLLWMSDVLSQKILHKESNLYVLEHVRRLLKPYDESYHIKDIRLPLLDSYNERILSAEMFDDTFYSYVFCNDRYDEATFDRCDKFLSEGLYGLVNDKVNVTVKPGDIVIDAGAWIGDFAAYASVKGATVYAFEPTEQAYTYLEKTAELNKNIIPVKKGLADCTAKMNIALTSTSGSRFTQTYEAGSSNADVVSIDDFVKGNNLSRVDFIKSDIEGFERYMLEDAQETLRRFAPKLALCTYHLPDDPEVMASLILKANPKYNIVKKRKKLFASVPAE